MKLVGAVSVLLALLCVDGVLITSHLIEIDHYGRKVSMDVTRDTERNTVLTVIGDVSMYKNGRHSVNLHDFNTNYGVLKDINKKMCLLAESTLKQPTEDMYKVGLTYNVKHHELDINEEEMTKEEVLELAGENIASFCADYNTYLATVKPAKTWPHARKMSAAAQSTYWCVFSSCKADTLSL
ncbi:uncharacterized protein LOC132729306 [Ruditapes philippinarum]|uniref:uncharacterized protein LOC132729306 n=1 Tax=Ruditapes philippinarum TaxID=129788 RepID=UPI00295BF732|nr:uncharacterized protein LOC132729306 [Ruditapes philippinarum]